MDTQSFNITRLDNFEEANNLHGYCVESTATINVEDGDCNSENIIELTSKWFSSLASFLGIKQATNSQIKPENEQQYIKIDEIAKHLVKGNNPQLVINIHGYSTDINAAKKRNEDIYKYAVDNELCQENSIFIGYRWPSKNVFFSLPIFQEALEALPTLLLGTLITTLALIFIPVSLIFGKWTLGWAIISFSLSFLVWFLAKANGALPIFPNGIFLVIFSSILFIVLKYPLSVIESKIDVILTSYPGLNWLKNTIDFWSNHSWGLLVIAILLISAIIYQTIVKKKPIFPNHTSFFFFCLAIFVIFTIAINWFEISTSWLPVALFSFFVSLCSIVFALILLRLSNYPRDRFRAFNYGVMDLVEFIRKLEKAIEKNLPESKQLKIDLSFIAHSLGCEVVTQTIRLLTNVFDRNQDDLYINEFFKLERLVLVAPDIPVESILSGRANFLQYPLHRLKESYVFSNEADLALRLASTAANYFSFPSKSRFRGYKLGNVTAKHFVDENDKRDRRLEQLDDYGIINLNIDRLGEPERFNAPFSVKAPIDWLEIRASNIEHRSLQELVGKQPYSTENVANQFTYFDCTDYKENNQGVINYALKKSALNIFDYLSLVLAKPLANIDGHGDYFKGEFSQKMIYELAFLGFEGFLYRNWENKPQKPLTKFANDCRDKYIQAILSEKLQKFLGSNQIK